MIAKEVERLDCNKSFSASLIKKNEYSKETLINTHIFSSHVEASEFNNCGITNLRSSITDFEVLGFVGSTIVGSKIKSGEISAIVIENTTVSGSNFEALRIKNGFFKKNVVFRGCKFTGVDFIGVFFEDVSFRCCKFLNCGFTRCEFGGVDSNINPTVANQNSFIECSLRNTTFDKCAFLSRVSTYNTRIIRNGVPSRSLIFDGSVGSMEIINSITEDGLSTTGFSGRISFKGHKITSYGKAIGVDIKSELTCYSDPWDSMSGSAWDVKRDPPIKKEKKDYPIRFISEGL